MVVEAKSVLLNASSLMTFFNVLRSTKPSPRLENIHRCDQSIWMMSGSDPPAYRVVRRSRYPASAAGSPLIVTPGSAS